VRGELHFQIKLTAPLFLLSSSLAFSRLMCLVACRNVTEKQKIRLQPTPSVLPWMIPDRNEIHLNSSQLHTEQTIPLHHNQLIFVTKHAGIFNTVTRALSAT